MSKLLGPETIKIIILSGNYSSWLYLFFFFFLLSVEEAEQIKKKKKTMLSINVGDHQKFNGPPNLIKAFKATNPS